MLFVLLDMLFVDEAAAQVTRMGMEALKFCRASTGMYILGCEATFWARPPPAALVLELLVGDRRPFWARYQLSR